jgi:hypothetical protein
VVKVWFSYVVAKLAGWGQATARGCVLMGHMCLLRRFFCVGGVLVWLVLVSCTGRLLFPVAAAAVRLWLKTNLLEKNWWALPKRTTVRLDILNILYILLKRRFFGRLAHAFGRLAHAFGRLAHAFGRLAHAFRASSPRFSRLFCRNL